jgi:hypothetical protein
MSAVAFPVVERGATGVVVKILSISAHHAKCSRFVLTVFPFGADFTVTRLVVFGDIYAVVCKERACQASHTRGSTTI